MHRRARTAKRRLVGREQSRSTVESIAHDDAEAFAQRILAEHAATPAGEYGRITLVVCNTVDRACETFDALRAAGRTDGIELVHSRFRPAEREGWRERFLSRSACSPDADRIIVATQVVEAGVDISAGCLITELAPWPSLVQRFGRCARYGGNGRVLVVDRGRDEATAAPYQLEELESAWEALQITARTLALRVWRSHEESLSPEARARLYPYAPAHLLLRREFDELFDTTPDLTGADLDISRFIRSGDERDFRFSGLTWRRSKSPRPPSVDLTGGNCAPFPSSRLATGCAAKKPRRTANRSFATEFVLGCGTGSTANGPRQPARVCCPAVSCASPRSAGAIGQNGDSIRNHERPFRHSAAGDPEDVQALDEADDRQDGENLSFNAWKTIACHSSEVASAVREIAEELRLPDELREHLELAARWHDWGKSHPAFQGAMRARRSARSPRLGKGPGRVLAAAPGHVSLSG